MQGVAVSRRQLSVNSDQDVRQTYYHGCRCDETCLRGELKRKKEIAGHEMTLAFKESCVVCRYCGAKL